MTERMPEMRPTPKDERDIAAQRKAEYEEAQFLADQLEAFGKFDVTAPNEGEMTYQEYLERRPSDGIVRDDGSYRNAESGRFASTASYEAQAGDTQAYYDQKGGIENSGEYQPNYEAMGLLELAKEAAKARQLNDPATEKEIRQAVEHYLTMDAMKDDSETPEEAQERYFADLDRYEELIDRFLKRGEGQHAKTSHTPSEGEGTPSQRASESEAAGADSAEEAATAEVVEEPEEVQPTPTEEAEKPQEASKPVEAGGYYNGKKVTVANFESEDAVTVVDEDGAVHTIRADEINYKGSATAESIEQDEKVPGKELELYQPETKELVAVEQEAAKKWWQKAGSYIRERAGVAYWAAQFEGAKHGAKEWFLNRGIDDSMTEDEKEEKRRHNRHVNIAGGVALAGLGVLVTGVLVAKGLSSGGAATSVGLGEHDDWTRHAADSFGNKSGSGTTETVVNLPLDGSPTIDAETIPQAPTGAEISVGAGEGGEALFQRVGLEPSAWYDNAQTLLANYPQDFYLDGNDVRIAHTGPLSQGAQDFINSLK